MAVSEPTLEVEHELFAAGVPSVIGMDEVGRGAIAGPVAVGAAVVVPACGPFPEGLRDSKLLSERARTRLEPLAREWVLYGAVGLASPAEVDELGITACLGLAGRRALLELHAVGADVTGSTVLLDGNSDWLSRALQRPLTITTRVKADRDCASVAAASVLAKVHRDRLMIELHEALPEYGWEGNKGYGSAQHLSALSEHGLTLHHRSSWLPAYT
ncbi:ribonuclease HII [Plantibacter sp. T3]|uniref:ribonuclease HII n=1 Tax=unclassified Plantibacter TaxID=2624265 RepID=UPI0012EF7C4C|nr:ribonuclease HII [Plantibacter sp. T3]VXC02611.1 Ribonuclease HII [Plantibacter sp. T3]